MTKTPLRLWPLLLTGMLAVSLSGLPTAVAQSSGDVNAPTQIRRGLLDFRAARRDATRKAAALTKMLEIGPEGREAVTTLLDQELTRLAKPIEDAPLNEILDGQIAQARQALASLRADPNLTHEQLEQVGLPALDALSTLWRQHEMVDQARYQKLGSVREDLQTLVAALKQVAEQSPAEAAVFAESQQRAEQLLAKASPPEDADLQQLAADNATAAARLDPKEVAGMQALNAMRVMCGLRPLRYDVQLSEAARGHSGDMKQLGFFSHESPVEGKKSFVDRAKKAGTTASGENIYAGNDSPINAIKGWFLSPGHHKNMLGDGHRRIGLGRSGTYWTMLLGG